MSLQSYGGTSRRHEGAGKLHSSGSEWQEQAVEGRLRSGYRSPIQDRISVRKNLTHNYCVLVTVSMARGLLLGPMYGAISLCICKCFLEGKSRTRHPKVARSSEQDSQWLVSIPLTHHLGFFFFLGFFFKQVQIWDMHLIDKSWVQKRTISLKT